MTAWRLLRGSVCAVITLYLIAPLAIVVVISFSAAPFLQFPPPGLSLRWYHRLLTDPGWLAAIGNSITYSSPPPSSPLCSAPRPPTPWSAAASRAHPSSSPS